jgi:integrase
MPVYRKGKEIWRVVIFHQGKRRDWVVHGTKKDAEAFEARKKVKIEAGSAVEGRTAPRFSIFCVDTYRPHAQVHLRSTTWSARRYQLATLMEFFGKLKLTAITPTHIAAYKQERLLAGVKPVSVNNELAVLQAVLSYARHLRLPVADLDIIKLPVVEKGRLVVWSVEDVEALLEKAARLSADLVPIILFLANTGCRRGEALALTWDSVDLEGRMVRIEPSEEWQPKSGRAREVPLSDELHDLMTKLPRRSRYVFPVPDSEDRYLSWPKRKFDRARKAAKLKGGPHTLRHTFASHFLKSVPDLFLLARVLGHSDARVTKLYSHLLPEHLARARNAVQFGAPPVLVAQTAKEKAARRWNVPQGSIAVASALPTRKPRSRRT